MSILLNAEKLTFRIYYEDTDAGGVVYYANYLKYFERGRTEYIRKRGFSVAEMAKADTLFVVHSINARYLAPAFHDDIIRVESSIDEIKRASLLFHSAISNDESDQLLVESHVKLACVSSDLKPKRIPEDMYNLFKENRSQNE